MHLPVKKIKRRRIIIPANQDILFLYLFSPPENSKFLRGNFSKIFAAVKPAIVAQPDPNREVPIIMAGSELPAAARIAIAVAGIKVIPAVLIARKVTIAFVAVPLFGFNLSASSLLLAQTLQHLGRACFPKCS
jgi:hypothetical protein